MEIDEQELVFNVSCVPYDFVVELVAALSGVLSVPGEYVARFSEEPTEYEWRFQSADASVSFRVVNYRSDQRTKGKTELRAETRGETLEIVLPLWRGLQELASRARADEYRTHWGRPFPFDALDRLTERVEHARAVSP